MTRESDKESNFLKVVAEIENKIDNAFLEKNFNEDKEDIKRKIVKAIDQLKDKIDFADLHSNLSSFNNVQFIELIKNKSVEELHEMLQEYTIY